MIKFLLFSFIGFVLFIIVVRFVINIYVSVFRKFYFWIYFIINIFLGKLFFNWRYLNYGGIFKLMKFEDFLEIIFFFKS